MVPIYGLHHIGLTVPNMDEAVRFFETMFGAVTVLRVDGVNVDDEFMKLRLGVPAGRRIEQQRVIVCGAGGNLGCSSIAARMTLRPSNATAKSAPAISPFR
jgi:catechol 2,3-dioxygenase-like lactoylglutathione lyase family enzyme